MTEIDLSNALSQSETDLFTPRAALAALGVKGSGRFQTSNNNTEQK